MGLAKDQTSVSHLCDQPYCERYAEGSRKIFRQYLVEKRVSIVDGREKKLSPEHLKRRKSFRRQGLRLFEGFKRYIRLRLANNFNAPCKTEAVMATLRNNPRVTE